MEPTTPDNDDEADAARDRDMAVLKSHVAQLAEHFDSVQIVCTRKDGAVEGTVMASWGEGNWYARYGSVREWVMKEEEGMRQEARPASE